MKKMNNKGFSLVELIVVVLIMAIIAVALAPQVMKWVENSRVSTDCTNYESMVENLQLAIADKEVYKVISALDPATASTGICYACIGEKGSTITATSADPAAKGTTVTTMPSSATMVEAVNFGLTKIDASWPEIAKKASAASPAYYAIKITSGKQANVAKVSANDPSTLKTGTDLS
ncbi:MAG: type II secretion system protein [Lachnospiraceae bacterium]|nr:type II secretion system protein [Lachnospiraceae bacterium]